MTTSAAVAHDTDRRRVEPSSSASACPVCFGGDASRLRAGRLRSKGCSSSSAQYARTSNSDAPSGAPSSTYTAQPSIIPAPRSPTTVVASARRCAPRTPRRSRTPSASTPSRSHTRHLSSPRVSRASAAISWQKSVDPRALKKMLRRLRLASRRSTSNDGASAAAARSMSRSSPARIPREASVVAASPAPSSPPPPPPSPPPSAPPAADQEDGAAAPRDDEPLKVPRDAEGGVDGAPDVGERGGGGAAGGDAEEAARAHLLAVAVVVLFLRLRRRAAQPARVRAPRLRRRRRAPRRHRRRRRRRRRRARAHLLAAAKGLERDVRPREAAAPRVGAVRGGGGVGGPRRRQLRGELGEPREAHPLVRRRPPREARIWRLAVLGRRAAGRRLCRRRRRPRPHPCAHVQVAPPPAPTARARRRRRPSTGGGGMAALQEERRLRREAERRARRARFRERFGAERRAAVELVRVPEPQPVLGGRRLRRRGRRAVGEGGEGGERRGRRAERRQRAADDVEKEAAGVSMWSWSVTSARAS